MRAAGAGGVVEAVLRDAHWDAQRCHDPFGIAQRARAHLPVHQCQVAGIALHREPEPGVASSSLACRYPTCMAAEGGSAGTARAHADTQRLFSLWTKSYAGVLTRCGAEIGHSWRAFLGPVVFSRLGACDGNLHGTA
jgi:hypothetical protein